MSPDAVLVVLRTTPSYRRHTCQTTIYLLFIYYLFMCVRALLGRWMAQPKNPTDREDGALGGARRCCAPVRPVGVVCQSQCTKRNVYMYMKHLSAVLNRHVRPLLSCLASRTHLALYTLCHYRKTTIAPHHRNPLDNHSTPFARHVVSALERSAKGKAKLVAVSCHANVMHRHAAPSAAAAAPTAARRASRNTWEHAH